MITSVEWFLIRYPLTPGLCIYINRMGSVFIFIVLSKWQNKENSINFQNRVLSRNSMEIMLFSILSGTFDKSLGSRYVLHRFYYWLYVSLM